MKHIRPGRLALALALALAGCGKSESEVDRPVADSSLETKPGLAISGGELVLPAVKGHPGAAYFTLANNGTKPVNLAAVTISGAGKTEMHQTTGGTMGPLSQAEIAAGASLAFARGGNHVMVFNLDPALAAGGTVEMTLTFADGDKLSSPLALKAAGEAAGMDHAGM